MLRLLLLLHLVFCFRQGSTQSVNMCVEKLTYIDDGSFVLYANGSSQCITRTCSCSVTIRNSCSPARFNLRSDKQSDSNGYNYTRTMYNDTLIYRQNNVINTLLWNETYVKADAIQNVGLLETFLMIAAYSGGCSPNYQLTFWTNGKCNSWYWNFTVDCQASTESSRTTPRREDASFTARDRPTATDRTTSGLSSTGLQEQADSERSSSIKSNEISSKTGMIAGIVAGVGGGLILLVVVIVIVVIIRRRRDQRESASAKRTVSIPNPYELHSAHAADAAANGRVISYYPPLNASPQYETEATNNPTQSQNIGSAADHSQDDSYDNFYGRNNEVLSSSDATDYYNAVAVGNDNGMATEAPPVDNNEVTVIDNSLYK